MFIPCLAKRLARERRDLREVGAKKKARDFSRAKTNFTINNQNLHRC
jgi:hypothetical protein